MKKSTIKLFIILCIPFFQSALSGMELQELKARTLCDAYLLTHDKKDYSNLRMGIGIMLQKLFPHHFSDFNTMSEEDNQAFLNAIRENNNDTVVDFLNDNTFVDKVPLCILNAAFAKTTKKKNTDLAQQIRVMIQQRKYWIGS